MKLPRILPLIAIVIGGLVVVRGIGLAPGLFEGAKAWAEEAAPEVAAQPALPPAAVCALTPEQLAQQAGVSPAELRILQSLQSRRTELDARDADFAAMLPLMATAEQKLDAKLQAMTDLRTELQTLLGQVDEREQAETDRLVSVYSAMRPRDAARVFATLDDSVRLPAAAAMRPRSLAAIMAQMDPAQARDLTEKLARRFQAQQARARLAAADPAPPPRRPQPAQGRRRRMRPPARPQPRSPHRRHLALRPLQRPEAAPAARTGASPAPRRTSAPRRAAPTRQPAAQPAAAQASAADAAGPRPYQAGGNAGASRSAATPAQGQQRTAPPVGQLIRPRTRIGHCRGGLAGVSPPG
ncbi:MAG: MotE family protein [Brevundimonas sp.]|nr:MAG: MotE family protein [Brevundimonas sp.]